MNQRVRTVASAVSEILTTFAVLLAFIVVITLLLPACTLAQQEAAERDLARIGRSAGDCLWRCGISCAANVATTAIANPPPVAPVDEDRLKEEIAKLCEDEPTHTQCKGVGE
jgi:hypothetical protein